MQHKVTEYEENQISEEVVLTNRGTIKKHFRKNDTRYIGLDTLDNYDGNTRGEKVLLRDLTLEHIKWAKENCKWGSRYLRGWKN